MKKVEHLNQESIEDAIHHLWIIQSSLHGISALFRELSPHACMSQEELYGIDQCLFKFSQELSESLDGLHDIKETKSDQTSTF